ncbi:major facilitator superfamily domain-containing protein [Lentinula edodes]|nr:major facilitator superfamily domain-containing protein [Lentinula edodes]KAJ3895838.1 major facilitator superfamily domain-containing protein [Lentinula edodes]
MGIPGTTSSGSSVHTRQTFAEESTLPELVQEQSTEVIRVTGKAENDTISLKSEGGRSTKVPLSVKILSVAMVTAIGFGSDWSSGVIGAMKSTLKKDLDINNTKYALLSGSEDFMKTALILFSGIITDRIGGAGAMLYGNAIYSVGAILIAAATTVRSYKFMILGTVIQAFGDIATQVAQYKVFSSWFAPSNGFASTLGFELGVGKIGSFVGKASANIIAENMGDFSWVYWMAVVMNVFTNVVTLIFWFFTRWCEKRYSAKHDPATGEKLTEKNDHFEIRKMLQLPWPFWCIIAFTAFQTSCAIVFTNNATEMAEQRFNVSAVTAGWYSAMAQYMGFFLVPCLGVFIDILGNRLSVMAICGIGMFIAMCLAKWGPTVSGTAASFGIYAVAESLGPVVIIDSIRTTMWYQEVFGSGYAIKIAVNNSMNIIVGIVAAVIQDKDDNSYNNVVGVYVFLAAGSMLVGIGSFVAGYFFIDLGRLQWTKKHRIRYGELINAQKEKFEEGDAGKKNRAFSVSMFTVVILLILGAWATYFWGLATGNNNA